MKILKLNFLFLIILFISACSSVPKNTANSCSIFEERYFWYKHAKKSEKKWGTPVYLQLAIIKMESSFDWLAKPPRQKLFKVIPYKRPSSSFGYSQAVKGTWIQYKNETGNKYAVRSRFRPVILTSLTTFLGIAPLLFNQSTQVLFLKPMAISLGIGILFATFVILLLVPVSYVIIDDFINLISGNKKKSA